MGKRHNTIRDAAEAGPSSNVSKTVMPDTMRDAAVACPSSYVSLTLMPDSDYLNIPVLAPATWKGLWINAQSGKGTDVVFEFGQENSTDEPTKKRHKMEPILAHKYVLTESSPKFKSMLENQEEGKEIKTIKILDTTPTIFRLFLKTLYTEELPEMVDLGNVSLLYTVAVKYQCDKPMMMLSNLMINCCNIDNLSEVFQYAECAWKYDDEPLRFACEKILIEQTDKILKSPEFLKVKPIVLNRLFRYPMLNIQSEKELIVALEKYFLTNFKKDEKNFNINLIDPAIGAIRYLTLEAKDIDATILLTDEEKKLLKGALNDPSNMKDVPRYLTTNNYRRFYSKVTSYPKHIFDEMIYKAYTKHCWACKEDHISVSCEETYTSRNGDPGLNREIQDISEQMCALYNEFALWHEYEPATIDRMMTLFNRYKDIIYQGVISL